MAVAYLGKGFLIIRNCRLPALKSLKTLKTLLAGTCKTNGLGILPFGCGLSWQGFFNHSKLPFARPQKPQNPQNPPGRYMQNQWFRHTAVWLWPILARLWPPHAFLVVRNCRLPALKSLKTLKTLLAGTCKTNGLGILPFGCGLSWQGFFNHSKLPFARPQKPQNPQNPLAGTCKTNGLGILPFGCGLSWQGSGLDMVF